MTLTYVDASVLIAAARGTGRIATRALAVLDDPVRQFAASEYLRLEVLPKAIFHRRTVEATLYQTFFAQISTWAPADDALLVQAFSLASKHGLAAMDALHVTAAQRLGAAEFVTGEHPEKPLFRVRGVVVRSLQD
jgi:predicted nucleic acid-binding protein